LAVSGGLSWSADKDLPEGKGREPGRGKAAPLVWQSSSEFGARARATGAVLFNLDHTYTPDTLEIIKRAKGRHEVILTRCAGDTIPKEYLRHADCVCLYPFFRTSSKGPAAHERIWPGYDHRLLNRVREIRRQVEGKRLVASISPEGAFRVSGMGRGRKLTKAEIRWVIFTIIGADYDGVMWDNRPPPGSRRGRAFARLGKDIRRYARELRAASPVSWVATTPGGGAMTALCSPKKLFVVLLMPGLLRPGPNGTIPVPLGLSVRTAQIIIAPPAGTTVERGEYLSGERLRLTFDGGLARAKYRLATGGDMLVFHLRPGTRRDERPVVPKPTEASKPTPLPESPRENRAFAWLPKSVFRARTRGKGGVFFNLNHSDPALVARRALEVAKTHRVVFERFGGDTISKELTSYASAVCFYPFQRRSPRGPVLTELLWPGLDHSLVNRVREIRKETAGRRLYANILSQKAFRIRGIPQGRKLTFAEMEWMILTVIGADYDGVLWDHKPNASSSVGAKLVPFPVTLSRFFCPEGAEVLGRGLTAPGQALTALRAWGSDTTFLEAALVALGKRIGKHANELGSASPVNWVRELAGHPISALSSRKKLFVVFIRPDLMRIGPEARIPIPVLSNAVKGRIAITLPSGVAIGTGEDIDGSSLTLSRDGNSVIADYQIAEGGTVLVFGLERTK
jgi:hypothetical protein